MLVYDAVPFRRSVDLCVQRCARRDVHSLGQVQTGLKHCIPPKELTERDGRNGVEAELSYEVQ